MRIVGIKPTYGRVSRYGIVAFACSLDQIGPFARDVARRRGAAPRGRRPRRARLDARAGSRARTSCSSCPPPTTRRPRGSGASASACRASTSSTAWSRASRRAIREAVAALEAAGATVEEVSLPHTDYGLATYYIVAPAEASSNLARYDGVRYGYSVRGGDDYLANYLATRGQGFGPEVKRRIMLGTYALSAGYYDAFYLKAQKVRTLIKRDFDVLWEEGFDALVAPTSPTVAFRFGAQDRGPGEDVPVRRVHAAGEHGRAARHVDAVRPVRGPAGRPPGHRRRLVRGWSCSGRRAPTRRHRRRRLARVEPARPRRARGPVDADARGADRRPRRPERAAS